MTGGLIVLAVTTLALVGVVVVNVVEWRRAQPTETYRTVGIVWRPGVIQPWPGLHQALDAAYYVLISEWPGRVGISDERGDQYLDLMDFWLDIVAAEDPVTGSLVPSDGSHIAGTLDMRAFFFGLVRKRIVLVRQIKSVDGVLLPASESALWHEIAQHLVPWITRGDMDIGHAPEWQALESRIRAKYLRDRNPKAV